VLRNRAKDDGQTAVLEPRTRRPASSPSEFSDEVKEQAIGMRKALESSRLDHGPISVHEKMHDGLGPGPVHGVAGPHLPPSRRKPAWSRRKKPRSAWRRFAYPAPNACWQLDGTEYVLSGGRTCVILQLIDDHSRYAVGPHVAWGETAEAAIGVSDRAVTNHVVPQRLLSDNGTALNPTRRGRHG